MHDPIEIPAEIGGIVHEDQQWDFCRGSRPRSLAIMPGLHASSHHPRR